MAHLKLLGIPTFDVNIVFTNLYVEEGSDEKLSFPWISAAQIEGKQNSPTVKDLKVYITWYLENSDLVNTSWKKIQISLDGNILTNNTKLIQNRTYVATLLASGGKRKRRTLKSRRKKRKTPKRRRKTHRKRKPRKKLKKRN